MNFKKIPVGKSGLSSGAQQGRPSLQPTVIDCGRVTEMGVKFVKSNQEIDNFEQSLFEVRHANRRLVAFL